MKHDYCWIGLFWYKEMYTYSLIEIYSNGASSSGSTVTLNKAGIYAITIQGLDDEIYSLDVELPMGTTIEGSVVTSDTASAGDYKSRRLYPPSFTVYFKVDSSHKTVSIDRNSRSIAVKFRILIEKLS